MKELEEIDIQIENSRVTIQSSQVDMNATMQKTVDFLTVPYKSTNSSGNSSPGARSSNRSLPFGSDSSRHALSNSVRAT